MSREVVIPGETIIAGEDYLPGDGVRREGNELVASRFGLAEISGRLVRIIPLSGVYIPRRGNIVIGRVIDITFNGWSIDINAPYLAFLPIIECPRFFNRYDLAENADIGDMIVAKVLNIKTRGVDLTLKGRGLGKLEKGMIIAVNSNKVPRVIGKEGSMINLIKEKSKCDIIVGQNGLIWLKGETIEDELFSEKAIKFVTERPFVEGLTEKTKEWLEEKKK
ncbi:KH domain-containing protein [Candidatus Pacearchaeota archaeon]|nr:KH domain-containing protein [Candidatus Pacearchaeota archaeon]